MRLVVTKLTKLLKYRISQTFVLQVSLNIFYSGIEYTEKDWVQPKVQHYPLENLQVSLDYQLYNLKVSA